MRITTACRDCGGPLPITTPNTTVHDHCTPKPTRTEQLCTAWLEAALDNDIALEEHIEQQMRDLDSQPPKMKAAALRYASWGWPVFPIRANTKRPATKHGFHDATTNPDRIEAWWDRHPHDNIGLPTGHQFDVIDIDTPDGIPTLIELLELDGDVHGYACTANAGIHLYILPNPDLTNMTRFKPGADYRAKGGYVVAPPSRLDGPGRGWSWIHHPSPAITGAQP